MKKSLLLFSVIFCIHFDMSSQEFQNDSRWISAASGLRMRDQPNLSGKKLDVIPYGERVNWLAEKDEVVYLAGTSGKWTKVKWGNTTGWVYGGFLSDLYNPDDEDNVEEIITLHSKKWGEDMSLCRVELNGYGFTLSKEGEINMGDNEYDLTKFYRYEKGISISINEGYEWGSTSYEFDAEKYTVKEIFSLACEIYGEKYKQYLDTSRGELILPSSTENWTRDNPDGYTTEIFSSEIIDGTFESFRIEEEEGCGVWWYFQILDGHIRFGDGGGC